jgi:hypothetical protein
MQNGQENVFPQKLNGRKQLVAAWFAIAIRMAIDLPKIMPTTMATAGEITGSLLPL